ncbi:MAG: cation diffusion facilitator family transporter [Mangrovibacterium sp.]
MSHEHHHHTPDHMGKAFAIGIGLNVLFVLVEIVFGLMANSSALLADATHNFSDVLSLVFAWLASFLASRKPQGRYTYGWRKSTILVSILNTVLLFAAVVIIAREAMEKFIHPQPIGGTQVMIVAGIGVLINGFTAMLFMKGQQHDLNIKGAFLHMAADAAVSLGVVLSGLLINATGKLWIDPLTSILIVLVVLISSWRLFIDSINLALDAVPRNINIKEVYCYLKSLDGVNSVHDLHVWGMSTTQVALTAHLYMPGGHTSDFISNLQHELSHRFNIRHCTIQIEDKEMDCINNSCEKG